jgi:hypothetical protein
MKKIQYLIFFLILTFSVAANEIDDLTKLADEGDAIAQNNLGYSYLYGLNGVKDLDKAIYYLNAAASQGQVNAMTTVGWFYFTGEFGAPKDNVQALYWNQRASDDGFTIASYNLGFFYYSGLAGVKQDLNMAKKYWYLSASQWVGSEGLHTSTVDDLLSEINQYNPNPTTKMIELRDLFIILLKSQPI